MSADYQSLMMLLADLNAENRRSPSPAREADLLELRQRAANSIRKAPMGDMHLAQCPADHYFRGQRGLPEIHRDALTRCCLRVFSSMERCLYAISSALKPWLI